jgi:two-component system LytT family response regulator
MRAFILDDEPDSVTLLQLSLMRYCPRITQTVCFTDPAVAFKEIKSAQPDILFLDIEMPGMNGFELLEQTMPVSFPVVFVTAYNQYAVKAFRMNALDYLVKPVTTSDLVDTVSRLSSSPIREQLDMVQQQMKGEPLKKIAIHAQSGISFVTLDDIIYVEASNNYSTLIMTNGKQLLLSKTLKDVQELLEQSHFLRIHRQFIVNLNQVKTFNRNDSILTMVDTAELPVARNQKEKLMDRYGSL